MVSQITISRTTVRDLPRIDALLSESYPALLKPDYPPSVLVTALPLIARANPSLLRSGTYFVAEDGEGGRWRRAAGPGRHRRAAWARAIWAISATWSRTPPPRGAGWPGRSSSAAFRRRGPRDDMDDGAIDAHGGALLPRHGVRGTRRDRGHAAPGHRLSRRGDGAWALSRGAFSSKKTARKTRVFLALAAQVALRSRSSRRGRGPAPAHPAGPISVHRPTVPEAGRSGNAPGSPSGT
jgi:hypothetical protein